MSFDQLDRTASSRQVGLPPRAPLLLLRHLSRYVISHMCVCIALQKNTLCFSVTLHVVFLSIRVLLCALCCTAVFWSPFNPAGFGRYCQKTPQPAVGELNRLVSSIIQNHKPWSSLDLIVTSSGPVNNINQLRSSQHHQPAPVQWSTSTSSGPVINIDQLRSKTGPDRRLCLLTVPFLNIYY